MIACITVSTCSSSGEWNDLMSNDKDVCLPFKLHDDWLKAHNNIAIRLATTIAIVELVVVAVGKIIWILVLSKVSK